MQDYLDFSKFKTIIYSPNGYYGSELLWNDASYAFQHRLEPVFWHKTNGMTEGVDQSDKWQFLTNNRIELADKLGIEIDVLPVWDYEYCEIK